MIKFNKPPKIYISSSISNASLIRTFRDKFKDVFICTSSWIELNQASYIVQHNKGALWDMCKQDIKAADLFVLYNRNMGDDHNNELVEIGMAMGMGKSVYEIGNSFRTVASEINDVRYIYHGSYKKVEGHDLETGFLNISMIHDN